MAIDVKQLSFARELEAITREKVLAELARDNPPVAWKRIYNGAINYLDTDKYAQGDVEPLYALPPVPEGWQLVPIVADVPLREKMQSIFRIGFGDTKRKWAELLAAAPKKG